MLSTSGIRVSLSVDARADAVEWAAQMGADRIELYTGPFASTFARDPAAGDAIYRRHVAAAECAAELGLGVNAGHDLDRHNVAGLVDLPGLLEVSIGHAIICRALEVGLGTAVRELVEALSRPGGRPVP